MENSRPDAPSGVDPHREASLESGGFSAERVSGSEALTGPAGGPELPADARATGADLPAGADRAAGAATPGGAPPEAGPAPATDGAPPTTRASSLVAYLALYTLLRIALVVALTAVLMIFMPLIVALLFAIIVQLPLSWLLFAGPRRKVNEAMAQASRRRRDERERLQAALHGDDSGA